MKQTTVALTDLYKWTVSEFQQMVTAGIIEEDAHVELLHGQIVQMSPVGKFHAACVSFLNDWLGQQLRSDFIIRVQDPIKMDDHSEPEPDIAVVKRRADFYASHLPGPDDIEFLIEVADSSLQKDQEVKAPLYARFGIKEFWLVDLSKQTLHHYTMPANDAYQQCKTFTLNDQFEHPLLGIVVISKLFPWL
ncbi:Uma2 family endonuclease [Lewinella cohaerens]|uniref:Uma2 family endonuclease n=1 Tax=Lewinella cohaerens TaxID=70995 RepID=UPI000377C4E1|nr:Uma2 family endonuclease [Lewinella cohaerens]